MRKNIDERVVTEFGKEWSKFDQSVVPSTQLHSTFMQYFAPFPLDTLSPTSEGFDLGCGSGRWASLLAPHVGKLHCIDPSSAALEVAKKNLATVTNCIFHLASVDDIPLCNSSMDFGYSLGVLHHIPNTKAGLHSCVEKLKPGAPFLVYLYYAFDNKPLWFRTLWRVSDVLRQIISALPYPVKYIASQVIALFVYWPLSRLARVLEGVGYDVSNFPLSAYRKKHFYTLRTDALDRFGTRLEKRFSKCQIEEMMLEVGLEKIKFSDHEPFWCATGYKRM